jgi:2-polyprenyl-3-methyl-5-hydroxy-6-metoxy-1,4-benzoquinol methylase
MAVRLDPVGAEKKAIHQLVDFANKDVLEIGCGDGRVTWSFAPLARSVLALDLRQHEIAKAKINTPPSLKPKVVFRVADIRTASIPAAAYDVAVYSNSL